MTGPGGEEQEVNKSGETLSSRARVLSLLPGYEKAINLSKYVNLKMLNETAKGLVRSNLEPQPAKLKPPSLPIDGISAPWWQLANYAADWMYYDLTSLEMNNVLTAIDECGLRYERLYESLGVGGDKKTDSLINSVTTKMWILSNEGRDKTESPETWLKRAISKVIEDEKLGENGPKVEGNLVDFFNSFVDLVKKGDWWNRVLEAQQRLTPLPN